MSAPDLCEHLERLHKTFDISDLDPDPLLIVREFEKDDDREVAGFIASAFAYGGVRTIMADIRGFFERLDGRPAEVIRRFDPARDDARFEGWYHRFHTGTDAVALCSALSNALTRWGSLERLFLAGYAEEDKTIAPALNRFQGALLAMSDVPGGPHYGHLFARPASGSACKRGNLFLRWMVRHTSPDLGIWRRVSPAKLVVPLDTHVARIGSMLGLTRRKTADWRMAEEITASLRRCDAEDPVKYDYALCRLGILGRCPQEHSQEHCAACVVRPVCAGSTQTPPLARSGRIVELSQSYTHTQSHTRLLRDER